MEKDDPQHGHARRTVVVAWICFAYLAVIPSLIFDLVFVTSQRSSILWRPAVLIVLGSAIAALALNLLAVARAVAFAKGLSVQTTNNAFLLCLGSTLLTGLIAAFTSFLMMRALVG